MRYPAAPKRLLTVGFALLAAALACSAPIAGGAATPTVEVAQVPTSTLVGVPPPATQIVTLPSGVTATSGAPAPGVTPSATVCNFDSAYVADLTIPDGTEVQIGTAFTKTWQIKNSGCQAWPAGTTLIFESGNQMSGPASVPVPETAVGGTQDISVDLKAPGPAGDFQGYWQLRTPSGVQFGDKIFVKIKSTAAPATSTPATIAFNVAFDSKWKCDTFWRLGFKLTNTGSQAIQSVSTALKSSGSSSNSDTPFEQQPPVAAPGCLNAGLESLAPNSSRWISISMGTTDPGSGNDTVTIIACTQNDLNGDCATKKLKFSY